MALSFSRPDPSSPAAVGSAAFPVTKRGFDQGEVRDFLRMVAAELARLQEREKFLDAELRALQTRGMSAPGRLDEETVATLLGEEAARVLTAAREAATQIRDRAEEQATRLVKEAADDAARMRETAMTDAARIRDDAAADAESEIDLAKQQGRDMVNEAREYREKVLSELSRRREAARAQIEQLLHDRDRLTNAFERARIASEHVLGELHEAHEEPEFIVDLSPTTGPIPAISPEHPSVKPFDHEELVEEELDVAADVETDVAGDAEVIEITEINETSISEEIGGDTSSIAEIEINDSAAEEVPVEEPADSGHPVHAVPVVDDEVTSSEPAEVEADVETEEPVTNVVSLFGRGRKPDVVAPAEDEVEPADDRGHPPVEAADTPAHDRAGDIFAQLRAGSTESVATKANGAHGKKGSSTKDSAKRESTEAEPAPEPARTKAKKSKAPAVVPADPEVFAARNEALAALVTQMSRKLKRVLADEQNSVLAHLRQKRSSLEIDAIFGTADEQAARYAAAIGDDAMAAAGAGSAATKSAGGSARRVTQKAVVESLTRVIADGLVASFRDEARVAIGEAEGDRDVLAGLVRDVYRAWKSESLDAHVDHIACAAHARGAYLALDNAAIVSWMVDPSSPCCSECEDNSLAGGVTKGENFPTGHAHPPAHLGCRCLAGPVRH
ncbi:MAG: hypothetical protein RLY50_63 [Actinomycetota bacterium]|jgi:DivIVA domain-containing protein